MLSSGVESPLDSSASDVIELYTGLPGSISTELMAVSEPTGGLDAKSDVSTPVLAHSDSLSARQRGTCAAENLCQKTEELGDMGKVFSRGPAESLVEDLGDLEKDEKNKKRNFMQLDCSVGGYQKRDKEARGAEEYPAECCALTSRESWSKEDPHLNQHEVKSLRTFCTETGGSLKNTGACSSCTSLPNPAALPEGNQSNVQVTAETLRKLTEEVQGMKANGTRKFSKAGHRNDRMSEALPAESSECPDIGTVMARAGVSGTSMLDFLEPLKVTNVESATEHPQEKNEYGLEAHTAMPSRTGSNVVSILETREEKLPSQNPVNELGTSVANCQTDQQAEENSAHDFCTGPVAKDNEPHRLSSVESCRMFSIKSSLVLCSVLENTCYLDFRNMPLGNNSTAVHGIINETPQKYLPQNIKSQAHDHGTEFVENGTSTSVSVEQISVVRSIGLSTGKTDQRDVSAGVGKLNSSELEEAAEVWRKLSVGENTDIHSYPKAQEGANSEHCHSSDFSCIASFPEEFSKANFKTVSSEGNKLKKDQGQFPVSDLCKNDMKGSSLETSIASHETGQTDRCFYNTCSKSSPPSSHSWLDLSTKQGKNSPEAQLLEKESESNTKSEELSGSLVEATETNSNDSLSTGKETNLIYTLNVTLPPIAEKSREPHVIECPPCTANEVSSRDKAQDNLSGKESIGASGTTGEQVPDVVLHKDELKSLVSSRTFENTSMTSKISQNNVKSSEGNRENVVTDLGKEDSDTWNCYNRNIRDHCTAASTSCVLSGSTCVDDVLPNRQSFDGEDDKKTEENGNLEGEASAGYDSKKVIIFPEADFPLACGSLACEGDWGNKGADLHGINGSEILCGTDEAKEQIGMCALQTDESDKIQTLDSPKASEGNQKNQTSEQLVVRYLSRKYCVHNFGFCNSPLGPEKRELDTCEKKEASSVAADPYSKCSASTCETQLLLKTINIPTQHGSQTDKALQAMENQCLACQNEFDGSVPLSRQHLGSLNNQPNTGLQTVATSVEGTKISIGSSQSEEKLLKPGSNLPPLVHKHPREDSFQGTLNENVVDLDSPSHVRNEDQSGYVGFVSDLIGEQTIKLKEHENQLERETKGTCGESFSDNKSYCSQHACFIKCAKEKTELVCAGNKMQQSSLKTRWLVENQENTVSAQFLPSSSIHGSLSYKPENMNVLSKKENKSLRTKSVSNSCCPHLTFEPHKEKGVQKGVTTSQFRMSDNQESSNETQGDSEASALSWGISLPEKKQLCTSPEDTQIEHCDSSSAEVSSKESSLTKPVSVTMSVKREGSNTEVPSAMRCLNAAETSRVCACSKGSLRDEGHSMLSVKDMDVTSLKSTHCGEELKDTYGEEKVGREVAPRKTLPIDPFCDGEDCSGALLEDSKESGSKIVSLNTENYVKVVEESSGSNLNNISKERKNETKLTNSAGTSLLSETVHGCEDVSDAETSPESQYNTTPTFHPHPNTLSNSCKEISPNCVVCSEACVPYKLNAQSKDNVKEVTEGQDTKPAHSVCKENEALGSERFDQIEKCQLLKQKKKCEKIKVNLSDQAQQEQKSKYQEKVKIPLQPSMLQGSDLLPSSSNELVIPTDKCQGPSEDDFVVRSSENTLCSTLQEVKRPKITTDIINSQFLKTQDSEMENLNLNLGYDGIPGAFGTTNKLRGPLPLKRQPGRTCKKVPTSYQPKTTRKSKQIKSTSLFENSPEMFPKQENTLLKSLYSSCKPPTMETETAMESVHMPRQKAKRCSWLSSLKFRKCTKEPALLSKLSAIASKLLTPAKSIHNLKPQPYPSEILPVGERYSQRIAKNLLEAFSWINRNLHSRWADSWCTKMFSFRPLALYPVESTKILFSELSCKPPMSFLDTPVFPIYFHIKLDSSPVTDLTGITPQHLGPVLGEMETPPSEWTFSFLLSQSCLDTTAFKEDDQDNELHSSLPVTTQGAVALHHDHGRNATAERRGGCSMLGLHTVLALSSPGCYRIWTRRRSLTSHIPTVQRLFISQFAQGLKGTRYPTSVSGDLVSSLPYSLGRVLSIWSQHGPSAPPSRITPLHSSHCRWQPSVGIENSYAMLPHFPVQCVGALQTAGREICLETSFPLPLPKPCSLPEPSPSPPRVSASELQVHGLDEADASVPACLRSQDDPELKKIETERRPKKVSQIRIRKTVPKPDPNLTPMGLPKPKRLKKKEFSLEEIYTNKNYKSPPPARSLETIFEEPKEKNGCLISVSQQKRKRILEFQDFTLPRKRKARGKAKAGGSFTRGKKAALQSAELDALLSQKLMDLEAFFAEEAEQEQASSI